MSFNSFKLHPQIMAGVKALGYTTPTPIQIQAIPPVLEGQDVMGLAQTGTGKTAAFVLPILQRLLPGTARQGPRPDHRPHARAGRADPCGHRGARPRHETAQRHHLRRREREPADPEAARRRRDRRGLPGPLAGPSSIRRPIDLSHLEVLVLDEADRMFDMGFLPDIRRIIKQLPVKRQTLMFSATMADDIRKLAHEVLHNPVTVQVGHTAPANTVSHALYPVEQHLKTALLMELLKHTDTESVLIFTRTKHRAKRIGQQLEKAGYKAASLQGNLSQNKRQEALDGFRERLLPDPGGDRHRRPRHRRFEHLPCHQLRHPGHDRRLHAPHRPHRPRSQDRATPLPSSRREDEPLVRSIERVLGEKIERRTLKDFDYKKSAPARDAEFARPPREPQRRRPEQARPDQRRTEQKRTEHKRPEQARPRTGAASPHSRPRSAPQPQQPGAHSSHAAAHLSSVRTFRPRTNR